MHKEEFAAVALSRTAGVGPVAFRQLLRAFGSAAGVLGAAPRELGEVKGVSREMASRIAQAADRREVERIVHFCKQHEVRILVAGQRNYPRALQQFEKAPAVLYYRGTADLHNPKTLAVVGTRRTSGEAGRQIERLLNPLTEYEPLIVSGLAYGVDTAAHRRALALGLPTLAVLGSGFRYIYPYANRKLAAEMVERDGGLLTEYPPWVTPEREHFPARNRIVAMLAEMTLVVESDVSGGSIITANMAHEAGRKVGACPGRGGDRSTAGCNALIREGKAYLIDGPEDIVRLLNWEPAARGRQQLQLFHSLPPEEQRLVGCLQAAADGLRIDELSHQLQLPPARLAGQLLNLEMQGILTALPGQRYRISAASPVSRAP